MANYQLPSPDILRQLVQYEPDTGKLFWLPRTSIYGPQWRQWNGRFAWREAVGSVDHSGYQRIGIFGNMTAAHRLAWAVHFGQYPDGVIDHINGIRNDNRLCNLRVVDMRDNARNRRPNKVKKSGLPHGVWMQESGSFSAKICVDGRDKHLGTFCTVKMAKEAFDAAKERYGFHPNHGVNTLLPTQA